MSGMSVARDTALPARTRLPLRRIALFATLAAAGAGAAWYGHGWWQTGRFIETTDDAYVGGEVTAISPHIAGFLAAVLVTDNQHVQAGQLLARLDRRDFQAAYDHAQAVVEARGAALAGLRAQSAMQQSAIQQAAADVSAKDARAAFTRIDGARYATLALTSAGSRQQAERTRVLDQEAQAEMTSSQAGLEAQKLRLRVLGAGIAEAQAAVAQAASDLRRAALDMGYTEIRAPIEGYVGNRAARAGAYASEGSYLMSVIPAAGLWVDANFKEDQLARMVPGQAASVIADVAPGQVLHGHVLSLAPGAGAVFSVIPAENATGNFTKIVQRVPVRIALDAADATLDRLRPGLSTTVSIDIRPAQ